MMGQQIGRPMCPLMGPRMGPIMGEMGRPPMGGRIRRMDQWKDRHDTVSRWFARFTSADTSLKGQDRTDRPSETMYSEQLSSKEDAGQRRRYVTRVSPAPWSRKNADDGLGSTTTSDLMWL
ncbi:hypothetical protein RB195_000548 [Necator americanus]|uniref:Uncharacterized protein n=1 Tax=Necator americanus TaxID=51031 RepID=A0ABR1DC03_NECAM